MSPEFLSRFSGEICQRSNVFEEIDISMTIATISKHKIEFFEECLTVLTQRLCFLMGSGRISTRGKFIFDV